MKIIERHQVTTVDLPGRKIQTLVGKGAYSASEKMTMGYAHYSDDSGPMEPHHHAEEICFVVDAHDSWVESGPTAQNLGNPVSLTKGMTLHVPALEWHVFRWEPGGYLDILFFYGQVDHIRPEEK